MKANELMIGDWVRRRWTCIDTGREVVKDFQITEIRKNGETLYAWGKGGNIGRVEKLEPIPLTPEILEKNGLVPDDFSPYYLPIKDGSIRFSKHQYGLYCNILHPYQRYDGVCNYVHELQHALRLCGITLNIEL